MQPQVLQVGEIEGASVLAKHAQSAGLKHVVLKDAPAALEALCTGRTELVFLGADIDLPKFFTGLNESKIAVPVVVAGPAQPVQNAVKAIRLGAIEYLATPLESEQVASLIEKFKPVEESDGPIAKDPKTRDLLSQAKQFAASHATVLLRGESGTGKEVFSKFIHAHSPRKNNSFVAVNCAAIPESLLESELFGHEKGAFSGALNKRLGKFQQADSGTLLLDEISEMDASLQAKLLRAIQERVIDPVGSNQPVPVDIRLVATTNRSLEEYVAEGKFREDLYFRLNVVMLEIPPLRERPGDIVPLATHFATHYGKQNGLKEVEITTDAQDKLLNCYWKGNVRELENTVHRAVLMMGTGHAMNPDHIVISPMSAQMAAKHVENQNAQSAQQNADSARARSSGAAAAYGAAGNMFASGMSKTPLVARPMEDVERELILNTLDYCKGNRTHAADILGISIRALKAKLQAYGEAGADAE